MPPPGNNRVKGTLGKFYEAGRKWSRDVQGFGATQKMVVVPVWSFQCLDRYFQIFLIFLEKEATTEISQTLALIKPPFLVF